MDALKPAGTYTDRTSAATNLHFDGEALMKWAQTQLGEKTFLFVVLLTQGYLTEKVMCTGKVGPIIMVFSCIPLCQFTQPLRKLQFEKTTLFKALECLKAWY